MSIGNYMTKKNKKWMIGKIEFKDKIKAWMKYIEPLGFNYLSPRNTGSTDHVSFLRAGLPAYQFIQDELEYGRTYHTVMDTYERLAQGDLTLDATIVAWLAICAADDPGRIPYTPIPEPRPRQF